MTRLLPVLLALVGLPLLAKPGPLPDLPGAKVDGSVLLPNQWSLRPVGKQVVIGDFPVNLAVHPSGKFVVALHAGYGQHELVSVALPEGKVVARVALGEAFYGLAFSPDGTRIYASGAGDEAVVEHAFKAGHFSEPQRIQLRDIKERGVPAGLADRAAWTALRSVGVVEVSRETGDKVSTGRRHHLGSQPADAAFFTKAVRGHGAT